MSELRLESTTYHYTVTPPPLGSPDEWPDMKKRYCESLTFRPGSLSFDVHVTAAKQHVRVRNVRVSGFRRLANGLFSGHLVHDAYYGDAPQFALKYTEQARAKHETASILGVSVERPEHRACRTS